MQDAHSAVRSRRGEAFLRRALAKRERVRRQLAMRILGVGASCDLGDMYLRLTAEGHDVRVFIRDFGELGVMDGMLARTEDWRAELDWVRAAGDDGVILFESTDYGAEQDALRRDGFHVIGGSALGDRLENDRAFGQDALASHGMRTIPAQRFARSEDAIAFIQEQPARYVLKLDGSSLAPWRNYVGQAQDGSDVIALLRGQAQRLGAIGEADTTFLVMRFVEGVETGVGAYFNGERFLQPACLDWEHKRFATGDLGELTGEMGTLVTYAGSTRLFDETLGKLAPMLGAVGHVGYVNLNTIINDAGVWPLELTCRFGYPGFAILGALQPRGWSELLRAMSDRASTAFTAAQGYALGVVLTVPPFPYRYGYAELSKGMPILFDATLGGDELARLCMGEVEQRDGQLVASGSIGYLMVANGTGASAEDAREQAYALARKVLVPNLRYRTDIGEAFIREGRATLQRLGYLDP